MIGKGKGKEKGKERESTKALAILIINHLGQSEKFRELYCTVLKRAVLYILLTIPRGS